MENRMRQTVVRKLFYALLEGAMEENGWSVEEVDGYFCVDRSEDEAKLLVYPVTRELSTNESSTVKAQGNAIEKLERRANELKECYLPCVAFGIAKYSLSDFEVCVVPTSIIRDYAEKGTVYSNCGGHLHYNYKKVEKGVPKGALLRRTWSDTMHN